MDIIAKPVSPSEKVDDATLREATLFLLEASLVDKDDPEENMRISYYWALNNSCPMRTLEETNGPLILDPAVIGGDIPKDIEDGVNEREALKSFFKLRSGLRNVGSVLMIGGESGSGKTHLGIYAAKIGLEYNPRKTLTIFIKITDSVRIRELEHNLGQCHSTFKEKEQRNEKVAAFLSEKMCEICKLEGKAREDLLRKGLTVSEQKEKAPTEPRYKYFEHTVLVVDEVISSTTILKALSTSVDVGFMKYIKETNMAKFFGTINIVCCSTGSKDSIRAAGSSSANYHSIQMRPSTNLFKKLLSDEALSDALLENRFMDIVENRRCAVFASQSVKRLTHYGSPQISKDREEIAAAEKQLTILSKNPYRTISNAISGHVVMSAAAEYASTNGLNGMTTEQRFALVAKAISEFFRMPSMEPGNLPFTDGGMDPIAKGIVDAHTAVEKTQTLSGEKAQTSDMGNEVTEKLTFTFSRAQMILACSAYGTVAIPMNSPESFEALSASVFALYLIALVSSDKAKVSVRDFLCALNRNWNTEDTETEQAIENAFERKREGALGNLLYLRTSRILNVEARIPFSPQHDLNGKLKSLLFRDIEENQKKYYVTAVMSPPYSPCADSFIICGQILFLIQSKKRINFGKSEAEVREEILNMGLIPEEEGGLSEHEMKKYAINVVFTSEMCQHFGIKCVVPIFCVEEEAPLSKIDCSKVRMPTQSEIKKMKKTNANKREKKDNKGTEAKQDEEAKTNYANKCFRSSTTVCTHPITVQPNIELQATLTRTVKGQDSTPWMYSPQNKQAEEGK